MNDLPISVTSFAPAQPSPKPAASDGARQQDEQGFNNVLARQMNDSDKQPSSSRSPADKSSRPAAEKEQPEEAESTATSPASAPLITASAEMLASLLVQQNPTGNPLPDAARQLATEAAEGSAQTGQTIGQALPDAHSLPSAKHAAAGDHTAGQMIQQMLTAGQGNAAANAAQIELTGGAKTSGAMEATPGLRAQSGSPAAELSASAPSAPQFAIPLPAAAAAPPANPAAISTPVSQPGWGDEFGQKITWMATQRNQSAELHLNPPQLGPLDVTLKMNGDQATALFTSPHAAVRDAIEQAIPRLRELLADSGIMLGNAMVSDQSAKNSQDYAPRKAPGKAQADSADNTTEIDGVAASSVTSVRRHNGMVDTFA